MRKIILRKHLFNSGEDYTWEKDLKIKEGLILYQK